MTIPSPVVAIAPGPRTLTEEDAAESRLLREALDSIPADPTKFGRWWGTVNGAWLLEHIEARVGITIAARFSSQYGAAFEPRDIAHTAVLILEQETALAGLRAADNQWAYLYQMLRNEMFRQMGTRGIIGVDFDQLALTSYEDVGTIDAVEDAIVRTIDVLAPLTPQPVRRHLAEAVAYFADRGQSRLSHAHTISARDEELTGLGLTRPQILALANVVLGARPRHGETSVLAGFLLDSDWNPETSVAHRAALKKYRARMLRETFSETSKNLAEAL
jgi:hypothetical protein